MVCRRIPVKVVGREDHDRAGDTAGRIRLNGGEWMETVHQLIEWAAVGIELLAVSVIVAAVAFMAVTRGTVRYLFKLENQGAYESYKHQLGKALLLSLELLVAADVVRTVVLEADAETMSGCLLSWSWSARS